MIPHVAFQAVMAGLNATYLVCSYYPVSQAHRIHLHASRHTLKLASVPPDWTAAQGRPAIYIHLSHCVFLLQH